MLAARDALEQLGAHHRSALTLRYLDGLSVPECAAVLDRTVHATEALLVRAKRAFRARLRGGGAVTTDPFEQLRVADEPGRPDRRFVAGLRNRVVAALDAAGLPTIDPARRGAPP